MATKKISADDISKIAERLQKLPAIKSSPTNTKAEAVKILAPEIEELRKRGYTFNQISEELTGKGLGISTATLKNYLYKKNKVEKKTTKKRPPKCVEMSGQMLNKYTHPAEEAREIAEQDAALIWMLELPLLPLNLASCERVEHAVILDPRPSLMNVAISMLC